MNKNEIIEKLKKLKAGKFLLNQNLKKFNSYKVGNNLEGVIYPNNYNDLIKILKFFRENKIKHKLLGNGTNVIFLEENYDGFLIKLDNFDKIQMYKKFMWVGAGVNLTDLSLKIGRLGYFGLEFAFGIPGTIGGAVYMNAGAYTKDMSTCTISAKVLTPDYKIIVLTNKELQFKYRSSFLKEHKGYILLEAKIEIRPANKKEVLDLMMDRMERRKSSQPLDMPSAGSVFKNPKDLSAGKLIDDLGLKGHKLKGAQISEKHANFIVNSGNAKGKDIAELINYIKEEVYLKYEIKLKEEQEYIS